MAYVIAPNSALVKENDQTFWKGRAYKGNTFIGDCCEVIIYRPLSGLEIRLVNDIKKAQARLKELGDKYTILEIWNQNGVDCWNFVDMA